jgi:hypothetical protein
MSAEQFECNLHTAAAREQENDDANRFGMGPELCGNCGNNLEDDDRLHLTEYRDSMRPGYHFRSFAFCNYACLVYYCRNLPATAWPGTGIAIQPGDGEADEEDETEEDDEGEEE